MAESLYPLSSAQLSSYLQSETPSNTSIADASPTSDYIRDRALEGLRSRCKSSLVSSKSTNMQPLFTKPQNRSSTVVTRPSTASGRKSRATTTASSVLGLSEPHSVVCAVSEARGVSPTVGLAFLNVTLAEATLCQICDNHSYVKTIHKIEMAAPSHVIFMPSACIPNKSSTLFMLVRELISDLCTLADRATWDEAAALEFMDNLALPTDLEPLKVAIQGKYYAVTCFSAVMRYIEEEFAVTFSPQSLRIRYQPSEHTMMIDISAIQSLEIMRNKADSKSKESLFGLLNHTVTPMGSRMLRSNLLQPPTQAESFLAPRYDALEELTTNEGMFRDVRKALKLFNDIEQILTKIVVVQSNDDIQRTEGQLNHILMLKGFLESVPELFKALKPAQSALLVKVRNLCDPQITTRPLRSILEIIEADVMYMKTPLDQRNQRTFAVKPEISGMLDVARQTYKELTEEIHQHVDDLQEMYKISPILKFDNGRTYWLCLRTDPADGEEPLPEIFRNVVRRKGKIECQTLDLVKLNMRLSDTANEVVIRSDAVIRNLVKTLQAEAANLFQVCESVALVDMIASFGQLASTQDYIRPDITGTFALKAARHPILDKTMSNSFVPNDYYATEQYRFHIITGCNMSGKTTYIRAVALLQIMAQIGCFVPAEYASFRIIHKIFARVSMDGDIEANLSTFSTEMREMAFILRNIDENSLAVIDELGRGTSTRDGLALSISISEALLGSKASIWFATHFVELARFFANQPGVLNLYLAVKQSTAEGSYPQMIMTFKANAGTVDETQHYGIHLAMAMGFPASFTQRAKEVADDLQQKRKANDKSSESQKLIARRKLVLNLHESLIQAQELGSEETLPSYLDQLQKEFILRMVEITNMQ